MESQSVTNADAEFRRGLEELVRDHLNTCMVLAGSNSSSNMLDHENDECHLCHYHSPRQRDDGQVQHGNGQICQAGNLGYCHGQYHRDDQQQEEEEGNDQLVRGRGHGNLVRRQASILSRWAVCHAQEMITTMERQAREAELLALAGLHAVSMLDASFLREPSRRSEPAVAMENSVERPRRTSSLVQRWRELEEERRAERARQEFDGRVAFQASSENFPESSGELGNNHQSYSTDVLEPGINRGMREELRHQTQESDHSEVSSREEVNLDNNDSDANEINARDELQGNGGELEREALPVNENEREAVRQIVRRLSAESVMRDGLSNTVQIDNRNSLLGENERESVRELARGWVHVTSQQSVDALEGRRSTPELYGLQPGSVRMQARERETVLEGATTVDLEPNSRERFNRDAQWLRDRQAVVALLMRIEREREDELQGLLEHRAVSDFAYRNRLQSFLRGRFFRNGTTNEEEEPTSSAARELGQLRQHRAVSGLREGFRFRLERILRNQVNGRSLQSRSTTQDELQRRRAASQQVAQLTGEASDVVNREIPPQDASRDWQGITVARGVSDLQSLEEATADSMELQELLGRRSVSNLLASEFRDRLDQLIRSLLHSQGRTTVTWDFTRSGQTTAAPQQQQQQQRQQQPPPPPPPLPPRRQEQHQQQQAQVQTPIDEGVVNAAEVATFTEPPLPPPPPPPPQPLWQQELQHATWARPAFQRPSFMEWENMNELRVDVAKLQQGMSNLQRMMETCMEMQLELQRAVRQEVAGALQTMFAGKAVPEEAIDGSKWVTVKKGICCVCCDKSIDSLLYRCGHMCTCLKCASELVRNSGKCPMCRAPIAEVVRAFTIA